MKLFLTKQILSERLGDYPAENYLMIQNVIKGVVLYVATVALLQILLDLPSEWSKLLPWAASFAAILITHTKWRRGVLLSNAYANTLDSVFPLLMGVAEIALFMVLLKETGNWWPNWFLAMAFHGLSAVCLVLNRMIMTNVTTDFDDDLKALGEKLKGWLRVDVFGALGVTVVSALVWILDKTWIWQKYGPQATEHVQPIFAGILAIILWQPTLAANKERNEIIEFVESLPVPSAKST